MVGPCCLMSIVRLMTPAIILSVATGDKRERVVSSTRGLMWNLADSLWNEKKYVCAFLVTCSKMKEDKSGGRVGEQEQE